MVNVLKDIQQENTREKSDNLQGSKQSLLEKKNKKHTNSRIITKATDITLDVCCVTRECDIPL